MHIFRLKLILPLALILFGLSLRSYNYLHTPFDFDQVQIAQAADEILTGNPTLIGPRTGPAAMFTGPLIYYVTAFFGLFSSTHIALIYTTLFISMITGASLYGLSYRYLGFKQALIMTSLWASSPLLTHLDRIPWNPNLTLLAAALVFIPSLKITKGLNLRDSLIVAIGVFLGYQAHFSGLLLLPLFVLTYLIFSPKRQLKILVAPILGLFVTLVPTILFDYRHNWLNFQGLTSLIFNRDQVSSFSFLPRLYDKSKITIETLGALVFSKNSPSLVLTSGLIFIGGWIYNQVKLKQTREMLLPLTWFGVVVLGYSFYREATPEYYFLILGPVFLFIISKWLESMLNNRVIIFLLLLLFFQSSLLTHASFSKNQGLNLKTQLAAIAGIKQLSSQTLISDVVLETEFSRDLGLKYFLSKANLAYAPGGNIVRVNHPSDNKTKYSLRISPDTTIWIDPRSNPELFYLSETEFILAMPKYWRIFEIESRDELGDSNYGYMVFNSQLELMAKLLVYYKGDQTEFVDSVWDKEPLPNPYTFTHGWRTTPVFAPSDLISLHNNKLFVLTQVTDPVELSKLEVIGYF